MGRQGGERTPRHKNEQHLTLEIPECHSPDSENVATDLDVERRFKDKHYLSDAVEWKEVKYRVLNFNWRMRTSALDSCEIRIKL